jgi:pyruvate kinase
VQISKRLAALHARPTRAETSDVANAILLSGETAEGRNPVDPVSVMDRIASIYRESFLYRAAAQR